MATKIVTKNSSTAGAAPTATDLVQGELAVNVADKRLFTEDNGGAIVELGTNPYNFTANHNGSAKLATTSTGIDVTGTVVANDLTLGDSSPTLNFNDSDIANLNHYITSASNANLYYAADSAAVATGKHVFTTQNVERFEINSTGIDVTGTATMDGLTVDGDGSFKTGSGAVLTVGTTNASAAAGQVVGQITFDNADISGNKANAEIRGMAHDAFGRTNIDFRTGDSGSLKTRALVSWNGDISFYEDTGTTPKFFWDASAESLGIGTSSPVSELDVAGITPTLTIKDTQNKSWTSSDTTLGELAFRISDASGIGAHNVAFVRAVNDITSSSTPSGALSFGVAPNNSNASEAMRIDSSGNVGIASGRLRVASGDDEGTQLNAWSTAGGDGNLAAFNLLFNTGSNSARTERMRIDSSGNLLVGHTSAEADSSGTTLYQNGQTVHKADGAYALELVRSTSDGEIARFRKNGTIVGSIGTHSGGGTYFYSNSGSDSGLTFWSNVIAPSTSSGGFRDAVTDLGASGGSFKDLYLSGTALASNYRSTSSSAGAVGLVTTDSTLSVLSSNTTSYGYGVSTNALGGLDIMANQVGQPIRFWCGTTNTAGTVQERMRIDGSGNLLVGTTTTNIATEGTVLYGGNEKGVMTLSTINKPALYVNRSNAGSVVQFRTGGSTIVGSIDITASATTYSTSSDQRLKDNIADADDAGSKIDAIQVRKYDWKADGSHQDYGMIAQELQAVAPEAVSGDADSEEMMGVDYSKLVPMLIKEIQSLRNRVAQLETGE